MSTHLRDATVDDCHEITRLVKALADYEKEPEAAVATPEDFRRALFPEAGDPVAHCVLAELDGRVVGMALWFRTFSTWTGQPGIHLEDLFVEPEARGHGLGKALLTRLAEIAVERGWKRVEWAVLTWNTPSIEFYESLRATRMGDWWTYRLDGEALEALAATAGE